jgi:hypothetical protein
MSEAQTQQEKRQGTCLFNPLGCYPLDCKYEQIMGKECPRLHFNPDPVLPLLEEGERSFDGGYDSNTGEKWATGEKR